VRPPHPRAHARIGTDSPPHVPRLNQRDLLDGLIHEYKRAAA